MKILSSFVLLLLVLAAIFAVVSVAVSAASLRRQGSTLEPPLLPMHYISPFIEWTATNVSGHNPPYVNGVPPPPPASDPNAQYFQTQGLTYYDWEYQAMIEHRYGNCINIFPGFSNKGWSCTFHNTGGKTYLISNTTHLPPCCVFGDPWHPPQPDFLRKDVNYSIAGESVEWKNREPTPFATWFKIGEIPPPTGPFYYAFTQARHEPSVVLPPVEVFDSFSFPGIQGWAIQNFYNQRFDKPPKEVWDLPQVCESAAKIPNCGFFGVNEKLYTARHNYRNLQK